MSFVAFRSFLRTMTRRKSRRPTAYMCLSKGAVVFQLCRRSGTIHSSNLVTRTTVSEEWEKKIGSFSFLCINSYSRVRYPEKESQSCPFPFEPRKKPPKKLKLQTNPRDSQVPSDCCCCPFLLSSSPLSPRAPVLFLSFPGGRYVTRVLLGSLLWLKRRPGKWG